MVFDVPRWLASVARCEREAVVLERETRGRGGVHLRYRITDTDRLAEVTLRTLGQPQGGAGGWEIVAWIGRQAERVEVPAGTRFVWR